VSEKYLIEGRTD